MRSSRPLSHWGCNGCKRIRDPPVPASGVLERRSESIERGKEKPPVMSHYDLFLGFLRLLSW